MLDIRACDEENLLHAWAEGPVILPCPLPVPRNIVIQYTMKHRLRFISDSKSNLNSTSIKALGSDPCAMRFF